MKEQKSYYAKPSDISRDWLCIDAENQVLGRVASTAASILRGKSKAIFTPSVDVGDFVVILNADKIVLTGNKEDQKVYYDHSRFPGGLKETSYKAMMAKKPEAVLYRAIKGMLPHNRIGSQMLKKLKVYSGSEHPHEAQNPKLIEIK